MAKGILELARQVAERIQVRGFQDLTARRNAGVEDSLDIFDEDLELARRPSSSSRLQQFLVRYLRAAGSRRYSFRAMVIFSYHTPAPPDTMSISELGSLGELIGAIGVIASLIYLAAQVRGARRVARAENVREVFDGFRRTNLAIATDPELAELWLAGLNDPSRLSQHERLRFHTLLSDHLFSYREIQEARSQGMVSGSDHDRIGDYVGSLLATPGGTEYWNRFARGAFSEEVLVAITPFRDKAEPLVTPAPD